MVNTGGGTTTAATVGKVAGFVYVDGVVYPTIQAAIDATASGGHVIIPPGTYDLATTGLKLLQSNVTLECASKTATLITYRGSGAALLISRPAPKQPADVTIENCAFDGTGSNGAIGISAVRTVNLLLINNVVSNFATSYQVDASGNFAGVTMLDHNMARNCTTAALSITGDATGPQGGATSDTSVVGGDYHCNGRGNVVYMNHAGTLSLVGRVLLEGGHACFHATGTVADVMGVGVDMEACDVGWLLDPGARRIQSQGTDYYSVTTQWVNHGTDNERHDITGTATDLYQYARGSCSAVQGGEICIDSSAADPRIRIYRSTNGGPVYYPFYIQNTSGALQFFAGPPAGIGRESVNLVGELNRSGQWSVASLSGINSTAPVTNLNAYPVTYNANGAQIINSHTVQGTGLFSSGAAMIVLSGPAAFTGNNSFVCSFNETVMTSNANVLTYSAADGSHFVVHSSNPGDGNSFSYSCQGN
jgi:hypothetical protein